MTAEIMKLKATARGTFNLIMFQRLNGPRATAPGHIFTNYVLNLSRSILLIVPTHFIRGGTIYSTVFLFSHFSPIDILYRIVSGIIRKLVKRTIQLILFRISFFSEELRSFVNVSIISVVLFTFFVIFA